jgi:hypothetical protein
MTYLNQTTKKDFWKEIKDTIRFTTLLEIKGQTTPIIVDETAKQIWDKGWDLCWVQVGGRIGNISL